MKQRLIEVWCRLEQSTVDMAVDQWRRKLRACVRAKGGHFEHSLLTYWLRWFCQCCHLGCYVLFKCCIAEWNNGVVAFIFILVLVLQDNAATKLRCGEKLYSQLIRKWFLVTMLKELLKSANIYRNYSKNKSGTVFLTHSLDSVPRDTRVCS